MPPFAWRFECMLIFFFLCSRLFGNEGRSFAFDNRGTGYGRGEGCGMIIIKPLDQAIRDNDPIRSVIVGSGINQDGKTPGITMPNGQAQGMSDRLRGALDPPSKATPLS